MNKEIFQELNKKFTKRKNEIIKSIRPVENPKFILLGGQPGSGKSNLAELIKTQIKNIEILDIDEYTKWHPKYELYKQINSELGKCSGQNKSLKKHSDQLLSEIRTDVWVFEKKMVDWLIEKKYNFLMDQTLGGSHIQFNIESTKNAKEKGFSVEVHCLVVNDFVSKLGVFSRFEKQLKEKNFGRMVPLEYQEQSYHKIPENLETLLKTNSVDCAYLYQKINTYPPKIIAPIKINDYSIVKEIMYKIRMSHFSDKEMKALSNWVKSIEKRIEARNGNVQKFHNALKKTFHKGLSYRQQINKIISGNSKSIKK